MRDLLAIGFGMLWTYRHRGQSHRGGSLLRTINRPSYVAVPVQLVRCRHAYLLTYPSEDVTMWMWDVHEELRSSEIRAIDGRRADELCARAITCFTCRDEVLYLRQRLTSGSCRRICAVEGSTPTIIEVSSSDLQELRLQRRSLRRIRYI